MPDFKHAHEIKIGEEIYVGKSNKSVIEAKRNVAYETLMKTEYAFSEIPEELKKFKPKSKFLSLQLNHFVAINIFCQ